MNKENIKREIESINFHFDKNKFPNLEVLKIAYEVDDYSFELKYSLFNGSFTSLVIKEKEVEECIIGEYGSYMFDFEKLKKLEEKVN